ncbi:undecaprenyldiphospho-muramoylpentapeptide beta-N-acetylglucosaminyltransferase [Endozoicomonas numazuensis]|uniref:UDP-N-acetylglucosamine--N-acetylmuramyl-(pentapeptide) pyrophosphoryl-undecaprenol N-acetylglucosamine transferase n=1 Tax=Endozoicomonas numazuensis TaxID=1137799 RepID=A0A081NE87_9GAMM|nr:undecaprenyldiphospho-muramoylpentapeptide beta-N-acetylglucosaminyltransferase [Endozoicomonas numazuensis]KEQ16760.1 UDP-diphospho-muramoylpentapeptide beta-N- acetylglucosaminyltransferase [Endozoicomonas numazuensis]
MSSNDKPTVLIMAGGTGGHIFPALATARELEKRGYAIHWLGTPNSMEAELVPRHGFEISFIPVTGLRGKGLSFLLKAPWKLAVSLSKALKVIRRCKPVCVLGMGGFVTGPGGVAARLAGVPLVIHEQNAIAGFTNKILSRIARKVLLAFPGAFDSSKSAVSRSGKFILTGNPVRTDIADLDVPEGLSTRALKLLVVGGSRGAVAINELVPKVLTQFKGRIEVWHQTGKNNLDATRELYHALDVEGCIEPFIDDMARAYEWADLVICRSGALTVSELAMAQRAAVLVPYPYAVDDHQTVNGQYLVNQGAALMVQQKNLNENCLVDMLENIVGNPQQLVTMARAAGSVAKPMAAVEVADHCLEVAHAR